MKIEKEKRKKREWWWCLKESSKGIKNTIVVLGKPNKKTRKNSKNSMLYSKEILEEQNRSLRKKL